MFLLLLLASTYSVRGYADCADVLAVSVCPVGGEIDDAGHESAERKLSGACGTCGVVIQNSGSCKVYRCGTPRPPSPTKPPVIEEPKTPVVVASTATTISDAQADSMPIHVVGVGATAGAHSAGSDGSVSYTVPITMPKGMSGIQPNLVFAYNNNAGNGAMGVGWAVAGLSSIQRCPNDHQLRGEVRDPVNFNSSDKFCLDGNRMVLVSGRYGYDGAEYRLENENFTKIISYGRAGNGPSYFRIWTKDGLIKEFGRTNNAKAYRTVYGTINNVRPFNDVVTWGVNEIKDRYSNYYTATYTSGKFRVERISYTGNKTTGLVASNHIDFKYSESRPDPILTHMAGSRILQKWRLDKVEVKTGNTLIKWYDLRYRAPANAIVLSHLESIQECLHRGLCLPKTSFTLASNGMFFSFATKSGSRLNQLKTGDFNGDGISDVYSVHGDKLILKQGSRAASTLLTQRTLHMPSGYSLHTDLDWHWLADFNGDGNTDIAYEYNGNLNVCYVNTFRLSCKTALTSTPWGDAGHAYTGDFNGDGLPDIASRKGSFVYVKLATTTGFVEETWEAEGLFGGKEKVWSGDFNGDGLTDFATIAGFGGNAFVEAKYADPESNRFVRSNALIFSGNGEIKAGDFNGDGLTDLVNYDGSTAKILLATGTGFVTDIWPINSNWGSGSYTWAADFNGDGLTDLLSAQREHMYVKLSTGTGFEYVYVRGDNNWGDAAYVTMGDFDANGTLDIVAESKGTLYIKKNNMKSQEVRVITAGNGHKTLLTYDHLTNPSIYTPVTRAFPLSDGRSTQKVITKVRTSNGLGGYFSTSYQYKGLASHQLHGSLGFLSVKTKNDLNGIATDSITQQDFSRGTHGLIKQVKTTTSSGVVMSDTNNTWERRVIGSGESKRYTVRLTQTDITKKDLNDTYLSFEANAYTYDNYENPTVIVSKTAQKVEYIEHLSAPERIKTTVNTYKPIDASNHLLPALTKTSVALSSWDREATVIRRVSGWTFDLSTGKKTAEIIYHPDAADVANPGEALILKKTRFEDIDSYGHHQKVTVSGSDFAERSSTVKYAYNLSSGYLVSVATKNALEHESQVEYYPAGHPNVGLPKISMNINGLKTYHEYDQLGRQKKSIAYYGTAKPVITEMAYQWCENISDGNYCEEKAIGKPRYRMSSKTQGSGVSHVFVDVIGREVKRSTQSADGRYLHVRNGYNSQGRNTHVCDPYYDGDKEYHTVVEHDAIGRVIRSTLPDGRVDAVNYNGLTQTSWMDVNGVNQSKKEIRNSLGHLIIVGDSAGNHVRYKYDLEGQLTLVTDSAKNKTIIKYDALGRKVEMDDPDKGLWKYTYNSLGQLITQQNAKGETTCNAYDVLGRLDMRSDLYAGTVSSSLGSASNSTDQCDARGVGAKVSNWDYYYDKANLGSLGKLRFTTSTGSLGDVFITAYAYDEIYGHTITTHSNIDSAWNIIETTYDRYHRPDIVTYPGESNRLQVVSKYNDLGFNYRLSDANTNKSYYDVKEVDAHGNVTELLLGNGVTTTKQFYKDTNRIGTIRSHSALALSDYDIQNSYFYFDRLGNLKGRTDYSQGFYEDFDYDILNRLTDSTFRVGTSGTANNRQKTTVTYDALGNIKTKSGIGTYSYGAECGGIKAGPHAVTRITSPKSASYCYDKNGNMTSGAGRTIEYTAFDKPSRITKGSHTSSIFYGADRNRYKRIDVNNGQTTTYHYVGGIYEKVIMPSKTEERHFIGGSIVLTLTNRTATSAGTKKTRYLHMDHIGSITAITDEMGAIQEEFSFDPWGKRRPVNQDDIRVRLGSGVIASWGSLSTNQQASFIGYNAFSLTSQVTNKGFTGHEQLDGVGLIHMNGRVYDADIGRFISADPFVQDMTNLQALNRYSYVQNNPLSYTDPSGYFLKNIFKKFRKVIKEVGRGVKSLLQAVGRVINAIPGMSTVVGLVISFYCPPCGAYYFANLSLLQAAISLANGVPIGAVLTGVAVGVATSGLAAGIDSIIGNELVTGALAAGIAAKAQGGKFSDGIKSFAASRLEGGIRDSALSSMSVGDSKAEVDTASESEAKQSGASCGANPINIATGEKYLTMRDYEVQGSGKLMLERYYSSIRNDQTMMGTGWRTNFNKTLKLSGSKSIGYFRAVFLREQGDPVEFVKIEDEHGAINWKNIHTDNTNILHRVGERWELHLSNNTIETYNTEGQLLTVRDLSGYTQTLHYVNYRGEQRLENVTDSYGQKLIFTYDYKQRVKAVKSNGDVVATYHYDINNNLSKATAIDGSFKAYHYDDNRFNHAITSITNHHDEQIHSMAYDTAGRAVLSALGDGAERYEISFSQGPKQMVSTVTNSAGKNTVYTFNKRNQPIKIEGHASATCLASNQGYTYNEEGRLASKVDWNGTQTRYEYNVRGLETLRIEAAGTEQERHISTQWHANYRLPVRVEIPGLVTHYDYDAQGLLVQRTLRDTTQKRTALQRLAGRHHDRIWRYTYNEQGLLATTNGPLSGDTDMTSYVYNAAGHQTSVINALGYQAHTLAFNPRGLATLVEGANGIQTELRYNDRGWLTHKILKGDATEGRADEITEYRYTGTSDYLGKGLVAEVISANGQSLRYGYDKARRLISQTNSQGERIEYTLDLEGNRTAQTIVSATGDIIQQTRAVYDELSRLLKTIGADNRIIADYHYDKAGNQERFIDALGRETHYAYDTLNRLVATSDVDGTVEQAYNAQDQLTQVTDQRGLITEYRYNGFGEKVMQISPDTGVTTFAYDAAGHIVAKVDSRKVVTQYRYDAIGRVTDVIYPAANDDNIHYTYDAAVNDDATDNQYLVGRLASVVDGSGETHYQYNHRGQVVRESYTIGNTAYAMAYDYSAAGQLLATHYPSGRVVNNQLSSTGRLLAVTSTGFNGQVQAIAQDFKRQAFGGLTGLSYGNNTQLHLGRDAEQRLRDIQLTTAANDVLHDVSYVYDAVNNIQAMDDAVAPEYSQTFGYDASYRLTSASGRYGELAYQYDAVGNRLTRIHKQQNGQGELEHIQETYAYAQDSNRLLAVATVDHHDAEHQRALAYDAVGNIVQDGQHGDNRTLMYGANNRLAQVERDDAAVNAIYAYNYQGQRVSKTVDGLTTHFHFDANKQLVAETVVSAGVKPVREYVYAAGMRLAMVGYADGEAVNFVVNDHLGSPTLLTDANQAIIWRADATPFGDQMVSANVQPLRFPGQYADGETGYSYNYFRDYDPSLGRYIQSDPIGLAGGVNTFGYVGGNPTLMVDPMGLDFFQIGFTQQASVGMGVAHDTGIYFGWGRSGSFDFGVYTTGTYVAGTNFGVDPAGVMFAWSSGDVSNVAGYSGGYEVGADLLFIDTTIAQEFTDAGDVVNNLSFEFSVDGSLLGPASAQGTLSVTKTKSGVEFLRDSFEKAKDMCDL